MAAARHVPAIEQYVQKTVQQRVAELASDPIEVQVEGHYTTLRGRVQDATERETLLAAARSVSGVRTVNDELELSVLKPGAPTPSRLDTAEFDLGIELWPTRSTPRDKILTPERPIEGKPRTLVLGSLLPPWRAPAVFNHGKRDKDVQAKILMASASDRSAATDTAIDAPVLTLPWIAAGGTADTPLINIPGDAVSPRTAAPRTAAPRTLAHTGLEVENRKDPTELTRAISVAAQDITAEEPPPAEASRKQSNMTTDEALPDPAQPRLEMVDLPPQGTTDAPADEALNPPSSRPTAAPTDRAERQSADTADVKSHELSAEKPAVGRSTERVEAATGQAKVGAPVVQRSVADQLGALRAAFDALPDTQILFQSDSDVPTSKSLTVLDQIASILVQYPDVFVDIGGHTDSAGNEFDNLYLSQDRSNAVRDYLVDRGVSPYRLLARGFGESLPIADNRSPEGRAANRRIEFAFGVNGEL